MSMPSFFDSPVRVAKKAHRKSKKALKKGKEIQFPKQKRSKTLEWSELMTASFIGDVKLANTLLKDDLDVNRQDSDGVTALMLASREGHTEMVKILIKKGAQVDLQKKSGKSALMKASKRGHTEVVQLLLDRAHVNMQSEKGVSALMMASEHGKTEVVELLLQQNAAVNMQASGRWNTSALMMASDNGHTEVVKLLIKKEANVCMCDSLLEDDAFMKACGSGHLEVTKLLVEKGAPVDSRNKYNMTPLMKASYWDRHEIVQYLLDEGATINTQDSDGESALMRASTNEDSRIPQLLIDKGAEVNMQDNEGKTALIVASNYDHPQVVQLLIDNGALVNMQDKEGNTALSIASQEKSTSAVKQLIKNDAKVDHLTSDGFSPLMLTCNDDEPDIEIAELLLKNKAQIDLQNTKGLSSLMIATQSQHNELILSLLQHGASVDIQDNHGLSPLMLASEVGFEKMANLFIEYGAQLDLQDKDGKSALFHAVSSGCVDLASHLIELGAQVNLQDNNGWFPLMYAVKAGDLETVQILKAYGASIELRNCNGQTIFDVCPKELIYLPLFQEMLQTLLNTTTDNLKLDSEYPGIFFYKTPISKRITSSGATIDRLHDMGISISVPKGSLSPSEEPLDLHIHPCFRGPFRLPKKYISASPAYLICHSKKTNFHKDITIRIHHYACLESEEDCEEMTFLSASSTPEYKESRQDEGVVHPVYTFKKIRGANAKFRPVDQVGEISLRHFCIIKVGRKRSIQDSSVEAESEKKHKGSTHNPYSGNQRYYSARLYRNILHRGEVSSVFCICPFSQIYMQHCDNVISKEYTGMSKKGEGRSQVSALITGDEVIVQPIVNPDLSIAFDKKPTKIFKRDILIPELMQINFSELTDYPPRLLIYVKQTEPSCVSPPELQIIGLDQECTFEVPLPTAQPLHTPTLQQPMSMEVKGATVTTDGGELPSAYTTPLLHLGSQSLPSPDTASLATPPDMGATIAQELQFQGITSRSDSMTMLETANSNTLDCDNDLGDVLDAVESLASKWRRLCTKLRLKESTLDVIEHNNSGDVDGCLHKALGEWLKLNYDHQRHGRPSWRRLAEAVSSLDVALSEKIATTHISH